MSLDITELQTENSRIAALEREVGQLRKVVEVLVSLSGEPELEAAIRLQRNSPSSAELMRWAETSEPPEHLVNAPDL